MRFKVKTKPQPNIQAGETRTKLSFAWKPIKIGEFIVWLEFYKIVEIYKYNKDTKKLSWEVSQIYLK